MNNILIKGGIVVDGSGQNPFKGDILVRDGVIAEISDNIVCDNAIEIMADGLTVTPGFIDIHTHNELVLMESPERTGAITQGITTEIVGLCGLGVAPLDKEKTKEIISLYSGILGPYNSKIHNFKNFDDYLCALDNKALNVASAVTHGAVRAAVVGFENRPATTSEKKQMAELVAECIDQGAIGFSTGLTYFPAGYSDFSELVEICTAIKEKDGIFLSHKRDNYTQPRNLGDEEMVNLSMETGVKTHILHYRTSLDTAGMTQELTAPYSKLIEGGYDISFEFYPYAVGAGFGEVFLPPWVMDGGLQPALDRLADKSLHKKILDDMAERYSYLMPPSGAIISTLKQTPQHEGTPHLVGMTFAEVAKQNGWDELNVIVELLLQNDLEFGYYYNLAEDTDCSAVEDDFFRLLDLPFYTVGSDSIAYGSHPHPRAFGSFTRLLRLAKQKGYPIERLINRITKYPAERFNLKSKGQLAVGMDADIAIFDYNNITDRATFSEPTRLSEGMHHLLISGKLVLHNGNPTGDLHGRTLRKGKAI